MTLNATLEANLRNSCQNRFMFDSRRLILSLLFSTFTQKKKNFQSVKNTNILSLSLSLSIARLVHMLYALMHNICVLFFFLWYFELLQLLTFWFNKIALFFSETITLLLIPRCRCTVRRRSESVAGIFFNCEFLDFLNVINFFFVFPMWFCFWDKSTSFNWTRMTHSCCVGFIFCKVSC